MAAQKDLYHTAQYSRQLKESVKSLLDNFTEILNISMVNSEEHGVMQAQVEHRTNEIKVRAANMVRAAESLSKLVTDIQEFLILNDFSSINESIVHQASELDALLHERKKEVKDLYQSLQVPPAEQVDSQSIA